MRKMQYVSFSLNISFSLNVIEEPLRIMFIPVVWLGKDFLGWTKDSISRIT